MSSEPAAGEVASVTDGVAALSLRPNKNTFRVTRWDTEETHQISATSLDGLRAAVARTFGLQVDLCWLYWLLDDPDIRSRQKLKDGESWADYMRRHELVAVRLYLHVVTKAGPRSPDKDFGWALKQIQTKFVGRSGSLRNTSPSSAALVSNRSPTPPVSAGLMQADRTELTCVAVLERDFEAGSHYCVFCSVHFEDDELQAAHVIPHSVSERLGLDVSFELLSLIGHFESSHNAVAACSNCHMAFDHGLMWLEPGTPPEAAGNGTAATAAAAAATAPAAPVSPAAAATAAAAAAAVAAAAAKAAEAEAAAADEGIYLRANPPLSSLRVHYVEGYKGPRITTPPKLPTGNRDHLPFPPAAAWEWRVRWAPLKRAFMKARKQGEVVSGPCQVCSVSWANKDCDFHCCQGCCVNRAWSGGEQCKASHLKAFVAKRNAVAATAAAAAAAGLAAAAEPAAAEKEPNSAPAAATRPDPAAESSARLAAFCLRLHLRSICFQHTQCFEFENTTQQKQIRARGEKDAAALDGRNPSLSLSHPPLAPKQVSSKLFICADG